MPAELPEGPAADEGADDADDDVSEQAEAITADENRREKAGNETNNEPGENVHVDQSVQQAGHPGAVLARPVAMKKGLFHRFATRVASGAGNPVTFGLAVLVIVAWAVTGPLFSYSDTWQLCINTGTTIVTFLMVFLIQNSQNRDSFATQIKLDDLIRATRGAHNVLLDLEQHDDAELAQLRAHYADLAKQARADLDAGRNDTGVGDANP